mmetsp:Transcript_9942/g.25702  ORF Transcript_9942/g.25702 Transcript_9942/m.25702 type:complete len:161 (-) Transcript_9942:305-787(-)
MQCLLLACLTMAVASLQPAASSVFWSQCALRASTLRAQQYFGYHQQDQSDYAQQAQPLCVQAIADYLYPQQGELGFRTGDVIQVAQQGEAGGWWEGWINGQGGWFPSNYCSSPYYAQVPQQQATYGYTQDAAPPKLSREHDIYDPRSCTQTYQQWLDRAH